MSEKLAHCLAAEDRMPAGPRAPRAAGRPSPPPASPKGCTQPNKARVSMLFKTQPCRWFERSECPYGPKCKFAHGRQELRCVQKDGRFQTRLCDEYSRTGHCRYGFNCFFKHENGPLDLCAQHPADECVALHCGSNHCARAGSDRAVHASPAGVTSCGMSDCVDAGECQQGGGQPCCYGTDPWGFARGSGDLCEAGLAVSFGVGLHAGVPACRTNSAGRYCTGGGTRAHCAEHPCGNCARNYYQQARELCVQASGCTEGRRPGQRNLHVPGAQYAFGVGGYGPFGCVAVDPPELPAGGKPVHISVLKPHE